MSAPDKCPHCGESRWSHGRPGFQCRSIGNDQSDLCIELAAHAATKREHGQPTDEPDPNGSTHARLNWWKHRADGLNNELDTMAKQCLQAIAVETKLRSEITSWQQQAEQRLADANEWGRRAEAAEARVNELEGLPCGSRFYESGLVVDFIGIPLSRFIRADTTLGQAMPRKEGV